MSRYCTTTNTTKRSTRSELTSKYPVKTEPVIKTEPIIKTEPVIKTEPAIKTGETYGVYCTPGVSFSSAQPDVKYRVDLCHTQSQNFIPHESKKRPGRTVQIATNFKSRRQELLSKNKPVYIYSSTILSLWTPEDFKKFLEMKHENGALSIPQIGEQSRHDNVSEIFKMKQDRNVKVTKLDIEKIKWLRLPMQMVDRWYIIADSYILLRGIHFIEEILKTDETCRLRVPYEVLHDMTFMTRRSQPNWVTRPARYLVSHLERETAKGARSRFFVQGAIEAEDLLDHPYATDSILNCCLQMLKNYFFVVLITDDAERTTKAKALQLPCYRLQELKDLIVLDEKKLKIRVTIQNEHCLFS